MVSIYHHDRNINGLPAAQPSARREHPFALNFPAHLKMVIITIEITTTIITIAWFGQSSRSRDGSSPRASQLHPRNFAVYLSGP